MAKAQHGFIRGEDEVIFWGSLFDDLKEAVLADKIACSESEFHLAETKYDNRLWAPIIGIIETLSGGLQLCPWKSILESQIEDVVRQFLGKQPEKRENWSIAFVSDPHSKYMNRTQDIWNGKVRMYVHPQGVTGVVDGTGSEGSPVLECFVQPPIKAIDTGRRATGTLMTPKLNLFPLIVSSFKCQAHPYFSIGLHETLNRASM